MDKFLNYPYRPFVIGQYFGESRACVPANGVFPASKRKPVVGKVGNVCPKGYEELYPLLGDGLGNFMKGHTGLDLYGVRGSEWARSPINGTVIEICTELERGLGVGVVSDDAFDLGQHGKHRVKVRLWHFMSLNQNIRVGSKVTIGTPLGIPDSTGISSGDHIHLELKPVTVTGEVTEANTRNVYPNNGYFGSIDPNLYWTGKYALDVALNPIQKALETIRLALLAMLNK